MGSNFFCEKGSEEEGQARNHYGKIPFSGKNTEASLSNICTVGHLTRLLSIKYTNKLCEFSCKEHDVAHASSMFGCEYDLQMPYIKKVARRSCYFSCKIHIVMRNIPGIFQSEIDLLL